MTLALTGRRPVHPAADDDLKFNRNAKVTRTLTDRQPVRPAADDDFDNSKSSCILLHIMLTAVNSADDGGQSRDVSLEIGSQNWINIMYGIL